MAIIRWNPLRDVTSWNLGEFTPEFAQMQREFDRVFDRVLRGGSSTDGTTSTWLPAVDITEQENEYRVHVELPGLTKEDVKITMLNDVLTIRGEKKAEKETKGKSFHRTERSYGSFQRSFVLPMMVKNDQIEASFDSGILMVRLPKVEEMKPKEIEVKVK